MKNILIVTTHLLRQGPNVQLFYLCKYLDKSKLNIFITVIDKQRVGLDMTQDFIDIGVNINNLKLNRYSSIFNTCSKLKNIIINNHIDIVYSFSVRSNYFVSNLDSIIKITSVRNTLRINSEMVYGRFLGHLLYKVQKNYILKFDRVLSCSKTVQDHLKELGIESSVVRNSIEAPRSSKKKYDVLERNNFISISSRLRGKNIEFLLKSFAYNKSFRKYKLYIAGYVDDKTQFEYKNVSNISFLGHVKNLKKHFIKADYFISASLHEGLPNAVLESMKVGTPVILSDIPSHKEIIESSNLKFGEVFQNNNITSLVQSIKTIQQQNYLDLSNNAIVVIKTEYNPKSMANSFIDIISQHI